MVSNSAGSVTSAAVTLTVNPAPVAPAITAQPASTSVTAPASATFAVVAGGTPAPNCQWQQSTNSGSTWTAISGATACSYTTPATTTADSGKQFRAVVSNSAGSVTSAAVTLTVAAASVVPTFSVQPQNAAVTAPAAASFSALAAGTPTPTYQWQQSTDGGTTFVNINGATAVSYTTPATVAGDSGKRFRVVVSNAAGTSTSNAVVLTVTVSDVSPLSGRTWRTGQKLVAGDQAAAQSVQSAIDDAGNVTVAYVQSNGIRKVRYAMRGTPNASGTAPTWSAPVALDLADDPAAGPVEYWFPGVQAVTAAPGGNVAVMWDRLVPCNATTYQTTGGCIATYVSRYRMAAAGWDAPVEVPGMLPGTLAARGMSINDAGDVLVVASGWVRAVPFPGYAAKDALFMRAAGETTFRQQQLLDSKLGRVVVRMDNQGRLLMGADYTQGGTVDVVAFRGTVIDGLAMTPTVLDTRASTATLQIVEVGLNGQQAIVWNQNNGIGETSYAAIASTANAAFQVSDTGTALVPISYCSNCTQLFVTDSGDLLMYNIAGLGGQGRVRWTSAAGWGAMQSLVSATVGVPFSFNRRGDYLLVSTDDNTVGYTRAFDGLRNLALPEPGYVVGTRTTANSSSSYFYLYPYAYSNPVVSVSGIAFELLNWGFDVLPTPALPTGDGRNSVKNLWGFYLK